MNKHSPTLPCFMLKQNPVVHTVITDQTKDRSDELKPEKLIFCRQCHSQIAESKSAIATNGKHEHSFFNPHGIVFQICCFSSVPGSLSVGNTSKEFSWFADHTWQIAICRHCHSHLGWEFQSVDNSFFGLIKDNIYES